MSNKELAIIEELKDPWDWVAAGIGGVGGLIVSATFLGLDGGTSIILGAVTVYAAKKSIQSALHKSTVKKRAEKFIGFVENRKSSSKHKSMIESLKDDLALLDTGALSPDAVETALDKYIGDYQNRRDTAPLDRSKMRTVNLN